MKRRLTVEEELKRETLKAVTRRQFFRNCSTGMGAVALSSMLNPRLGAEESASQPKPAAPGNPLGVKAPHFAPRAKNIIYLHMAGAPSQLDLFDPKPKLTEFDRQPIPESFTKGERFAFIKGTPKILGSPYKFHRHGESGIVLSELLPGLAKVADDISVIRYFCDRVAVMKNGRIVEIGDVAQICERPQHEYTKTLMSAVPRPNPRLRADAPA